MYFTIRISSKSKEVLNSFLAFISEFDQTDLNLIVKYFPKQKIKKYITVLKSPHVNKSAQEQFEYRVYSKQLLVSSIQNLKFLYFLKKSQNSIFPFIKIKLEGHHDVKSHVFKILQFVDPNKLNIKFFSINMFDKSITKRSSQVFVQYLNLLDCYGELRVKK